MREVEVIISDNGDLIFDEIENYNGENNFTKLNVIVQGSFSLYDKYIDVEYIDLNNEIVTFRTPRLADSETYIFSYLIPFFAGQLEKIKIQFVFINGEVIGKSKVVEITYNKSINATDGIDPDTLNIIDDLITRVSVLENATNIRNTLEKTYTELAEMKANDSLIKGQYYAFEYQTKHVIQTNPSVEIHTGSVEKLIIMAIDVNAFDTRAFSLDFPADEIDFDFDLNLCTDGVTERTGWITRRKDRNGNNEVIGFDFRNVRFRRYKPLVSALTPYDENATHLSTQRVSYNGKIYALMGDMWRSLNYHSGIVPTNTANWIELGNVDDYVQAIRRPLNTSAFCTLDYTQYKDFLIFQDNDDNYNLSFIYNNKFDFSAISNFSLLSVILQGTINNNDLKFYGTEYVGVTLVSLRGTFTYNTGNNVYCAGIYLKESNFSNNHLGIFTALSCIDSSIINNTFTNGGGLSFATFVRATIQWNTISNMSFGNVFLIDSSLQYNTFSNLNIFASNTFVNKTIQYNTSVVVPLTYSGIDFHLATLIFSVTPCSFVLNDAGLLKLQYTDEEGIIQTVNPNA